MIALLPKQDPIITLFPKNYQQLFILFLIGSCYFHPFIEWIIPGSIVNISIFSCLLYKVFAYFLEIIRSNRLLKSIPVLACILAVMILCVNYIFSYFNESDRFIPIFGAIAMMQLSFPFLILFNFHRSSFVDLLYATRLVFYATVLLALSAIIESFLPYELKINIANFITRGKIGDAQSYTLTALPGLPQNLHRAGSVVFDPLAFGFYMTFGAILLFDNRKRFYFKIIASIGLLLSLGKSAIVISGISLASHFFRKFGALIQLAVFLFIIQRTSEWYPLLVSFGPKPNILIHMAGLASGWQEAVQNPFFGHGLGTSSYLIKLEAARRGSISPIPSGMVNGCESALGVILFQTGFPIATLLLLVFSYFWWVFYRNRQYMWTGFIAGYFASMLLNEAQLSISLTTIFFLLICTKFQSLRFAHERIAD